MPRRKITRRDGRTGAVLCSIMQNSHILLADDDAALLTSLSDYFGRYGFDVDIAANLADMRRLSEEGHYDLLIAEPMMPGQHLSLIHI